ncbi:MAG TPA: VOC family protein [Blastocatellia bacterium]|nr:VOC family protein [Blastocatellia bacterium]
MAQVDWYIEGVEFSCYEFDKRSGKRSRLHLDLYTNDREGEVARLIKIGATRYPWRHRPDDDLIVLEDPDGNLFCVVQVADGP